MKKYLNIFLWVMFFSLMAPSGMALASWNAVPGDSTYSWKIALENGLLAILPSDQLKSTTHSKLTERRLGEVSKVLSGVHASEGLDNLSAQILTTKEALNKIDNATDRQAAVALYIQTLNEVSTQLEQEKENRALAYLPPQNTNLNNNYNINQLKRTDRYSNTTTTTNTNVTRRTNTTPTTNTQILTTNTQQPEINEPINPPIIPVPPVPEEEDVIDEEIVEEIDETQEEIENIIEELEDIIEEAEEQVGAEQEEAPQQDEKQQGQGQKSNDNRNDKDNRDDRDDD